MNLKLLKAAKSRLFYLVYLFSFGFEFHSQVRWRSIQRLMHPNRSNVEIGAGNGLMSFNFVLRFKRPIHVLAFTDEEYLTALTISRVWDTIGKYAMIGKDDAQKLSTCPDNAYGQAFAIDVLEHVPDDHEAVVQLHRILKSKGRVIVSVPTPLYPLYFGESFDKAIGHLRHYSFASITALFENNG